MACQRPCGGTCRQDARVDVVLEAQRDAAELLSGLAGSIDFAGGLEQLSQSCDTSALSDFCSSERAISDWAYSRAEKRRAASPSSACVIVRSKRSRS
jgi:hypothetical protein